MTGVQTCALPISKVMNEDREVLIITNEGIIIRIAARDISKLGRITTGVKLMDIDSDKDIFVATIAKVKDTNPDGTPITEIEHEGDDDIMADEKDAD